MPAYDTTSVSARAELLSPEVRSKVSAMVENRAKDKQNTMSVEAELRARIPALETEAEELRAFKASHMQQIADAHTQAASEHKDLAADHAAVSAEHTDHADRKST